MYCASAFEVVPGFPASFELPTTETGPFKPPTSSFVQTFFDFLASAGTAELESFDCAGEAAGVAFGF
jgi:hypothetical protein